MSGESIGIMNDAFFVGRKELLSWANETFGLSYTKIEECGTGALYCQIMDRIYPGKVPMSKVNFAAKYDYENVDNYKILQGVFDKMMIKRAIPVPALVKCKYQDNLEFMQFMYNFYKTNCSNDHYDPLARRSKSKGANLPLNNPSGGVIAAPVATTAPTAAAAPKRTAPAPTTPATAKKAAPKPTRASPAKPTAPAVDVTAEIQRKEQRVRELEALVADLENEKRFYANKVAEVRELLEHGPLADEQNALVQQVRQVMGIQ